MRILDRYIVRTILLHTLMVAAVLLALTMMFTFLGQQDDIGIGSYDVGDAFVFTALSVPQQLFEGLPIAALIGSILGLGGLARDSELTVVRAAGVSVARIAGSAALAGLVLLVGLWVIGEYIAPPADQYARQLKIFSKYSEYTAAGSRNSWVKDGRRFLNIQQQTAQNMFGGVYLFEFAPDRSLLRVGRADTASDEGALIWRFLNYAETRFEGGGTRASRSATLDVEVNINQEFLGLAVVEPTALPIRGLYAYAAHLRANNLESTAYETALWSRIARTVSVILVCVLSVPFAFGPMRSSGNGTRMVIGILAGALYFLVNRTLENSAQVYGLDPLLAAWVPAAALALLAVASIRRVS